MNARRKQRMNLSSRYRMTADQHAAMVERQGGKCAICKEPMNRPCVDHDHATGKVRGLLCHRCNIRLSAVEDSAFRRRALAYLRVHA